MKTLPIAFIAFCLLLAGGCQDSANNEGKPLEIPFRPAESIDMSQYIGDVRYITLENHPQSAFMDVDKLVASQGNIFILDKKLRSVFCFDSTGRFRFRIQRVGHGPGEYQNLDAMWVKAETSELWLQSFWPAKIMVFSFEGILIREFKIRWPCRDLILIDNNRLVGFNPDEVEDDKGPLPGGIIIFNENGQVVSQPLIKGDTTVFWSVLYQRYITENDGEALILCQSDSVFRVNGNGDLTIDFQMNWGRKSMPEEWKRRYFSSPEGYDFMAEDVISAKDMLIAFGPIRIFRIFFRNHLEFALADLRTGKGIFSTQINSPNSLLPTIYPLTTGENELIGILDMTTLYALKDMEKPANMEADQREMFRRMDSIVDIAITRDRPILWFAKIKNDVLTSN